MSFRYEIIKRLDERDRKERIPHVEIFKAYDELVHYCVALKADSRSRRDTGDSNGASGEKLRDCERKLAEKQEEISDLLRKRGENAQAVIDLNRAVLEKDAEIAQLKRKLKAVECINIERENQIKSLQEELSDSGSANQTLRDEYIAIQATFSTRETACRQAQEEVERLRAQCLNLNNRLMDIENQKNEAEEAERRKVASQRLMEAVASMPSPVMDEPPEVEYPRVAVCYGANIPVRYKHKIEAHDGEVNAVSWSPSGRKFATGGGDRKVKIWEVVEDRLQMTGILSESNQGINCVQFDSDETSVLGCSNDHVTRIWTISDRRLRHAFHGHGNKVMTAKYIDVNQRIVSGSHDRTLKVWDLRSRGCEKTLFAGSYCYDLVASDSSGANIISGHYDKRLRFWDFHTDTPISDILMPGRITSLDLTVDRNYLLCCHRENCLEYMDLRTNRVVHSLSDEAFMVGMETSRAVFSPDGRYCVAGGHDGLLFFWNLMTGQLEKSLKGHNSCISACSWSPDGQSVLSVDKHKMLFLWSASAY